MIRKHFKKIIFVILCIFMIMIYFTADIYTKRNFKEANKEKSDGIYHIGTDTLPFTQEQLYDQIFDIHNIISVSIDMTNSEIKKLQKDFEQYEKSPIYRMANVTISITIPNDTTYSYYIEEVGIRLKGNTSRESLYNETKGILSLDHFKINFQETFDDKSDGYFNGEYYIDANGNSTWERDERKARKNRVFGNMAKIDVKWNRCLDSKYLREYYANEIFRSEGIAAPHIGLTTMKINITDKQKNSAYLGVYSIYEPIDSQFIKNNLLNANNQYILNPNGDYTDGDLYKAKWGNKNGNWIGANVTMECSYGIDDDINQIYYNYDLKTNKKKSDFSSISNLLKGLSNISSKDDLEKYVDMNYFIKFAAVTYALGNGDDMRNNYNNYYIYFYTDNSDAKSPTQKMIVIPYDYDRCLGITLNINYDGTAMTSMNPYSATTARHEEQQNPLYQYSVCEGGYYVQEYTEALREVLNNELFSIETFTTYYHIAKNNYEDKVTPSKDFDNVIEPKSGQNITREYFYFTIDTNNDQKQMNTKSTGAINQNLIISEYFTKILSTIRNVVDTY